MSPEKRIYTITLWGSVINVVLVVLKFVAGFVGHSSALVADAVHSLSDFLTDIVVVIFVRLSRRPQDEDHDYGHGKYETLATGLIGFMLLLAGGLICFEGLEKLFHVLFGEHRALQTPEWIAALVALMSIGLKEWAFRFTYRWGKRLDSSALRANAWHHRSDALSSVGTFLGVFGAIVLGGKWALLDPLAALVVGLLVIKEALEIITAASGELLEKSLPRDVEERIIEIVEAESGVSDVHNLRTRSIGHRIAIELHFRMRGTLPLNAVHRTTMSIERRLKEEFHAAHVTLHVEPEKVDGHYV